MAHYRAPSPCPVSILGGRQREMDRDPSQEKSSRPLSSQLLYSITPMITCFGCFIDFQIYHSHITVFEEEEQSFYILYTFKLPRESSMRYRKPCRHCLLFKGYTPTPCFATSPDAIMMRKQSGRYSMKCLSRTPVPLSLSQRVAAPQARSTTRRSYTFNLGPRSNLEGSRWPYHILIT